MALTFWGHLFDLRHLKQIQSVSDEEAMRSDWKLVGQDLRAAMRTAEKVTPYDDDNPEASGRF